MTFTERVIAYFVERPGLWIDARQLEQFGRQAWRTRVSEARQAFKASGEGDIENRQRRFMVNGQPFVVSDYRFVPAPKPTAAERERELHNQNEWGLR